MHSVSIAQPAESSEANLRLVYVWLIAFVAAFGGFLFGYDWVVIGGAKPFYEAYFHLHSPQAIAWANSSALVGCFLGSLVAGRISDRYGRKGALAIAALVFTVSSLLTGWSYSFTAFIIWRILGGVAIGLASNISPTYIAEISPAGWRGRLVSLNQLALVIGILIAQIANWRIAQPVPAHATEAMIAASWNAQFGWRWMFSAVAIPALILLICIPLIPESPRWLMTRGRDGDAKAVLSRVGGPSYGEAEVGAIRASLRASPEDGWRGLLSPEIRGLLLIGVLLAILQQFSGINIIFNYAEEVYRNAGYGVSDILFNIVITGTINLIFTLVAMGLIDRVGRRGLMIFGCFGIGLSHAAASYAYHLGAAGIGILALTLSAIGCYAMSLAPVTWVLIAEIFPNRVRASAISVSVAALWVASFILTYTFPFLNEALGTSGTFLIYGCICLVGGLFVIFNVPETKGRSLEQMGVQLSPMTAPQFPRAPELPARSDLL
jgi:SP family xylose:H+ symportor-like MFS transporter